MTGTQRWVMLVPEATPSRNQFHHKHWRVEYSAKKRWAKLFALVLKDIPKATGKRRVRVDRYSARRLDEDNFIGGLKGILDNMREFGLITDDNDAGIELLCRQMKTEPRQAPFTKITLEDL